MSEAPRSDGHGDPPPSGESRRGSVLDKSERVLVPEEVAPGVAVAMGLVGALAIAWLLLVPRGEPTPAFIHAARPPSDWILLGALVPILVLGASRRCFEFGVPSLVGWAIGLGAPFALAAAPLPIEAAPAVMGLVLVAGLLPRAPLARWRYWAALGVASFAVALFQASKLGFSLDPMPPEGMDARLPIVAAWVLATVGLGGGALVALTARRGDR